MKSTWRRGSLAFKRLFSDTLQLLHRKDNSIRSEVVNLPKIFNGPQGNVASMTTASSEMLNGLEKPLASLRIIPI